MTSRTDTVATSDLIVLFKSGDVDYRAAPFSALVTALQSALAFPNAWVRQDVAPSASPFTTAITSGNQNIFLRLAPTGTLAVGNLTLPLSSGCVDGQGILVNTTQTVTTLNINLNGATAALGAPTTLAANAWFEMVFDKTTGNWSRVG